MLDACFSSSVIFICYMWHRTMWLSLWDAKYCVSILMPELVGAAFRNLCILVLLYWTTSRFSLISCRSRFLFYVTKSIFTRFISVCLSIAMHPRPSYVVVPNWVRLRHNLRSVNVVKHDSCLSQPLKNFNEGIAACLVMTASRLCIVTSCYLLWSHVFWFTKR